MRYKTIPVKNIARLKDAGDALISRAHGMPGMGLIWGPTGYGKTTAVTWFVNQCHGVYVRAMELWAPSCMLSALAGEIDIDIKGLNNGKMVEAIVKGLVETGRPIFIDEADYVVESKRLINTLRDIHDLSTVPVILVGMHGIEKNIKKNEQFTGRISQWVNFEGIDHNDCRLLADGLTEVKIENDLLQKLFKAATPKTKDTRGAEVRRLVVGLGRIERCARASGLSAIGLNEWPHGDEFFIGSAVATGGAG